VVVQAPELKAGFAVAGGRSRRMGRDKALLPWSGSTLLDHTLERLRQVCPEVRILCGPKPRYQDRGAPVLVDAVADAGALGGVLAGLRSLAAGSGLFLAIDLPLVSVTALGRLVELARGFDAAVPVSPEGPEPLCAVYGTACKDPIARRVAAGEMKMTSFWPDVRVREVPIGELGSRDLFRNVNEPEDYSSLTER
jgi:molybdopterin-guanine dinucleotide biosynthesis protein A